MELPAGYRLRQGELNERSLLLQFLVRTYRELFPEQVDFSHLQATAEKYFSERTPLWWVDSSLPHRAIATLWMGSGIDQVTGEQYAHIFLLYVTPEHRRQGIAKVLLQLAETQARARGDRQIGLQVFLKNTAARQLYTNWGFQEQSLLLLKRI
jgi:GNAT superfamily N-acetyltransferase